MSNLHLIYVPYDSGRRGVRMGQGPLVIEQSLASRADLPMTSETVDLSADSWREIESSFALMGKVASSVAEALRKGRLPIVVSGNCCVSLGAHAGLRRESAVAWLDGHSDFESPETTDSGFLDGMGASMLLGRCWTGMTRRIPGFSPLPEERFIQLGVRDFMSNDAREALLVSNIASISPQQCLPEQLAGITARIAGRAPHGLHVHLDLDVHDPTIFRVNEYQEPQGLSPSFTIALLSLLRKMELMKSLAITAYDPALDPEHRVVAYVEELLRELCAQG